MAMCEAGRIVPATATQCGEIAGPTVDGGDREHDASEPRAADVAVKVVADIGESRCDVAPIVCG